MKKTIPYAHIDTPIESRSQPPILLEGQRIEHSSPAPLSFSNRHPRMRERQYAPYAQPLHPQQDPMAQPYNPPISGYDPRYQGHHQMDPRYAQPQTNVAVNNNGNFYRPVKEELALSFVKTIGNFFAWPFRLIGRLLEAAFMAGMGVLKMILLVLIAPMMLFTGYQYYQDHKDQPATEIAAELGKDGVGLVVSVIGGVWDGIFGDAEPEAPSEEEPAAK